MAFDGNNDMSGGGGGMGGGLLAGLGNSIPGGGLIEWGSGVLSDLLNGGPSSWCTDALHDWWTAYGYSDASDALAGARSSEAGYLEAYAQWLAAKNWPPKSGDPYGTMLTTRIAQINAMSGGDSSSNGGGGSQLIDTKDKAFVWFWPWTPGAMKQARWYHWCLWIGVPILALVGLWMAFKPNKYKKRWKAYKTAARTR